MKRIFVTLALMFVVTIPAVGSENFSGGSSDKISPRLKSQMEKLSESEFLTVVVNVKEPEGLESPKGLNRRETLKFLRDRAYKNQASILTYLSIRGKSDVKSVIPFWIFDGLVITAKKGIITELAKRADVILVESHDYYLPLEWRTNRVNSGLSILPVEWNILKIRADQVWTQGYTGEDVIIGFIDTGVDTSHPALIEHFSGLWFDAADSLSRPYDIAGHGTGMAGIAVGGDGPGPFPNDIGVAPGAEFAMARAVNDIGWLPEQYIYAAFQWYASLIDSGVDIRVLSCSWGSYWQSLSEWQSLLNLRRLGFIPVFAIGNNPSQVGCPGSYPTVIGVGNTDQNDSIALNSSRGPAPDHWPWNDTTYWGRPDWNLTKPDLCAPGTDINTSQPGGGYASHSGTSCSCPHVAGVIALMLQKTPSLDYNTIYNALLDNAVHLGDTIPNMDYGWGRLDALATVNSIPALGEEYISLMGRYLNELSGNGNGIPEPGETIELRIGLKSYDFGATGVEATLYSLNPLVSVLDSTASFGDIPADSVVINEGDPFVFEIDPSFPAGQKDTFAVNITTQIGGNWYDTLWVTIGQPALYIIFYDDFESGLDNWIADENWHISTSSYHSPTHCVMDTAHGISGDTLVQERLMLAHPLDLSGASNALLRFWVRNGLGSAMDQYLSVMLTADTTDSFAWHCVYEFSYSPSVPDSFIPVTVDISDLAGEDSVFLVFVMNYFFDFPWVFALDDVEILSDMPTGVSEDELIQPEVISLSTYPNPFTSSTGIRYSVARAEHIELKIYNLSGQMVKTLVDRCQKAGTYIVWWDGSGEKGRVMSSGLYFCKLMVGDKFSQTKKLLLLR